MREQEHEMRYPMKHQSQNAACDANQEPGNNRPHVTFSVTVTITREDWDRIALFAQSWLLRVTQCKQLTRKFPSDPPHRDWYNPRHSLNAKGRWAWCLKRCQYRYNELPFVQWYTRRSFTNRGLYSTDSLSLPFVRFVCRRCAADVCDDDSVTSDFYRCDLVKLRGTLNYLAWLFNRWTKKDRGEIIRCSESHIISIDRETSSSMNERCDKYTSFLPRSLPSNNSVFCSRWCSFAVAVLRLPKTL